MTQIPRDNKLIEHNLQLFNRRFPELAEMMHLHTVQNYQHLISRLPNEYRTIQCLKNSMGKTLIVHNLYVHSKYDSVAEGNLIAKAIPAQDKNILFLGLGLGYHIEFFLRQHTDYDCVIIEPDVFVFLLFLQTRELDIFFEHRKLTLLIGIPPNEACRFLTAAGKLEMQQYCLRTAQKISPAWYDEFNILCKRNRQRQEVNTNTAKKFFPLWFRNIAKNFSNSQTFLSLKELQNCYMESTAVIFAAGPSLEQSIAAFKSADFSNVIIISVDTAARALIAAGIPIDFVITGDPQYVNYRHLMGVPLDRCILVAEMASFPAILRLPAKAAAVFYQDLPIEKEILSQVEFKGAPVLLKSGGSVATTAYSFARFLGAKQIVFCGLDLAFTDKKTHFRGSTFEEAAHTAACRLEPAQTALLQALYNGKTEKAKSNDAAQNVLTDVRMKMYAWWFESMVASEKSVTVYTTSTQGLYIPGFSVITYQKALALIEKSRCNKEIIEHWIADAAIMTPENIMTGLQRLLSGLKHNKQFADILQGLTFFKNYDIRTDAFCKEAQVNTGQVSRASRRGLCTH